MTTPPPLTGLQLSDIRYRGARPSQYSAATIRQDYTSLLAALQQATDRAANLAQAYDAILTSAADEAREAEQIGRQSVQAELDAARAENDRLRAELDEMTKARDAAKRLAARHLTAARTAT